MTLWWITGSLEVRITRSIDHFKPILYALKTSKNMCLYVVRGYRYGALTVTG